MTNIDKLSFGELQRFVKTLHGAGFTEEDATRIIKEPNLASVMHASIQPKPVLPKRLYPSRDYSRYDQYLYSVADQLAFLRDVNKRLPQGLMIPEAWLDIDISTADGHMQSVEHLKTLHVEHDTVAKRWAFVQELVKLTQPDIYGDGLSLRNMQLKHTARRYPGIGLYLVGVNLVDNWDPEEGRTIDQARARDQKLAATEAIEAYALQHPVLYRYQDGRNLPYIDCAGLEQGDDFGRSPFSRWNGFAGVVCFGIHRSDRALKSYAAPSLVS